MSKSKKISVENFDIVVYSNDNEDYISLTDMARYRDRVRTNYIIQNWMRTRNAIEFNGLWEQLNNPVFKRIEFDAFKNEAGGNSFSLTPQKWIEDIQIHWYYFQSGCYGSLLLIKTSHLRLHLAKPSILYYLVKEFQCLKDEQISHN